MTAREPEAGPSTGRATAVGGAISAMTTPRSTWRGTRPGHRTKLAWGPHQTGSDGEPPSWGPARRLGWSLREAWSRGEGTPRGRPRRAPREGNPVEDAA